VVWVVSEVAPFSLSTRYRVAEAVET
jgi:hypothetical protein